jgi:hypothetical protein
MEAFFQFGVPALIGLVSGVIGSLIAPWVNWGIEKRRARLEARRRFIADARAELQHGPEKKQFRESVLYSRLLPHLSDRTIKQLMSDAITIQSGGRGAGVNNYIPQVLDDVRDLEAKWKLL